MADKRSIGPATWISVSRNSYSLQAEDDTIIHHGTFPPGVKAGQTYKLLPDETLRWPPLQIPGIGPLPRATNAVEWASLIALRNRHYARDGHFGIPTGPPRGIPIQIIDAEPCKEAGEVTWEIMQELGFGDAAGEVPKALQLSDLLARWTHAPDTDIDADISESVLGAMPEIDDDSSSGSGSTVD